MVLSIFAYLSVLIFLAAVIYRIVRIIATPVHLRWELYPVPHESGGKAKYGGSYLEESNWWTKPTSGSKIGELRVMIPEILLLKGIWEHNRGLWFWSWGFHFGLYLAAAAAFLIVATAIIGPSTAIGEIGISIAGTICLIGYILGAVGCLGMLVKRLTDHKLKPFTSSGTIFNLLFILAIFATGLFAISQSGSFDFITRIQRIIIGFVLFKGDIVPKTAAFAHVTVTLLFLVYMPFTHMAHFVLKYFTYHDVRWNDQPNLKGSKLEQKIVEALKYKPTWAAKHIKADGKKNWVDIATEEVGKNEKEA